MKIIMVIFLLISIFYYIQCYCEGDHDRIDLNKEQCSRYEIDQDEIEAKQKIQNFRCCFMSYVTILGEKTEECTVYEKSQENDFIQDVILDFFGADIKCSKNNNLSIKLNFPIILLLLLI